MPTSIKITGLAPPDLAGQPEPVRRQFWQLVAPIALKVKDDELARGLDAFGEPLKAISARTRKYRRSAMTPSGKGDPNAPPLMPAYQKSRVRSLMAARAFATHVELYWRFDPFTGDQFGRILTYQRTAGRDVFGISPDGTRKLRALAWSAWTKWKKGGLAPVEKKTAFPSAALKAGPQSRIAGIIARSAEPGAGTRAIESAGVGDLNTRWITRGIGAPKVKDLKARATRTGWQGRTEWQEYFGAEVPKPRPPIPTPIKAKIEAELGVKFAPAPVAQGNPEYTTVVVDVAKADADLALEPSSYVGPGGSGAAIGGRYEEFARFLAEAKAKGLAIEQPRAFIGTDGRFGLGDGRHRFAVLRDQGARAIPVSVRKDQAAAMRARYGYRP